MGDFEMYPLNGSGAHYDEGPSTRRQNGGTHEQSEPCLSPSSNSQLKQWKDLKWYEKIRIFILALAGLSSVEEEEGPELSSSAPEIPSSAIQDAPAREARANLLIEVERLHIGGSYDAEDQLNIGVASYQDVVCTEHDDAADDVVDGPKDRRSAVDGYDAPDGRLTHMVKHIFEPTRYSKALACWPPVFFLPFISLIEIVIFIYYAIDLEKKGNPMAFFTGMPFYSPLVYNPCERDELWRFVSYMLVHQGYEHLINNMVIQLLLGTSLELVHKWWRIPAVYLGGVIGGCLFHSMFDGNTFLVGASGGVFALISARLANIILNWSKMQAKETKHENKQKQSIPEKAVNFAASAPIQLTICLIYLGFAVFDFGTSIYYRVSLVEQNKSFAAHLGGFILGFPLGLLCLVNVRDKDEPKKKMKLSMKAIKLISFYAVLLIFLAALCVNLFYQGYFTPDSNICKLL